MEPPPTWETLYQPQIRLDPLEIGGYPALIQFVRDQQRQIEELRHALAALCEIMTATPIAPAHPAPGEEAADD